MATHKVTAEEMDVQAAKRYERLLAVHAEVNVERAPKRVQAVRIAGELITDGYSLRSAAKAAGQPANNKLQRYFEVARQMVAHSEGTEGAIAPPEGFSNWLDAVAATPLEQMADHIRAVKAGNKPTTTADPAGDVRKAANAALGKLAGLVAGTGKGKVAGLAVGKAQMAAYLKAFIAAGLVVDGAALDKLPLTPLTVEAKSEVEGIREKLAASLDAPATMAPAVNA